jgi:hypothetical protein
MPPSPQGKNLGQEEEIIPSESNVYDEELSVLSSLKYFFFDLGVEETLLAVEGAVVALVSRTDPLVDQVQAPSRPDNNMTISEIIQTYLEF